MQTQLPVSPSQFTPFFHHCFFFSFFAKTSYIYDRNTFLTVGMQPDQPDSPKEEWKHVRVRAMPIQLGFSACTFGLLLGSHDLE